MSDKRKKLVRELQDARGCSYTEALQELKELGSDVAWAPYIVKVRAQLAPTRILLKLCEACRKRVLGPSDASQDRGDGWLGLPKLCPEDDAKVAQCTRLLLSGGAIVFPASNARDVPGGLMHETRLEGP